MESVEFPKYARSKICWEIGNFCPELLRNHEFYSCDSPEFKITFSNYGRVTKWKLSIYRTQTAISCHLKKVDSTDYWSYKDYQNLSIAFKVGLQSDCDGPLINVTSGTIEDFWYSHRMGRLTNFKELTAQVRQGRLLSKKTLKIVVRLDLIDAKKLPPCTTAMSVQYEKLFNNDKFSDFMLVTSDEKEIPVHKNILSIRSPVFDTMMETKMRESKESKAVIDDIDGRSLMEFLRFVYCGRVEGMDEVAAELLYAASKYDLPDLKPLCVRSLTSQLSAANAIDTMMLADLHGEKKLKKFCIDFIKWHYVEMEELEAWKSLPQGLYKEILDDVLPVDNDNKAGVITLLSTVSIKPVGVAINASVQAAH